MPDMPGECQPQIAVRGPAMTALGPMALHRWIGQRVQRKLVLATGGFLLMVSAGFLLLITSFYQDRLIAENTRASMQVNRLLQATLENAMLKRDIPGLEQVLQALAAQGEIRNVMILNPDMQIRFSSDRTRLGETLATPLTQTALRVQIPQSEFLATQGGAEVLRSVNPVHNQQPCTVCHGATETHPVNGLLVVDYDAGVIRRDARTSTLKLALLGGGIIALVSAGIWALLWWIVIRPLARMSQATAALTQGRLDTRITPQGSDEIARLSRNFNTMSETLQDGLARLRQSEQFLQALIDAIPDGVRVIDENYRIIKANKSYCDMTGQSMAEVLSSPCYASSHHRDTPCPYTLVCCPIEELGCQSSQGHHAQGQQLAGQSAQGQITYRDTFKHPDGSDLYAEISAAPVDIETDGKISCCVVESIRDLEAQAQISQQQRLSEIGLLAAGVAHEINNPLSSVDLGIHAMQTELAEGKTDNLDSCFDMIRTEIQNCIKITDSLLLLSAPPGATDDLVDLSETVPEVLALLRFEADRHGVEISHDIPRGLRILASDSDVRMLVINLALNAIHAMPDGGLLCVNARREDSQIMLDVIDTGVGLSPEDIPHIFLPFWSRRANNTTGRGLGLAIVKGIMQRNNAEITVHSVRGKGSRFTARLNDADREA